MSSSLFNNMKILMYAKSTNQLTISNGKFFPSTLFLFHFISFIARPPTQMGSGRGVFKSHKCYKLSKITVY